MKTAIITALNLIFFFSASFSNAQASYQEIAQCTLKDSVKKEVSELVKLIPKKIPRKNTYEFQDAVLKRQMIISKDDTPKWASITFYGMKDGSHDLVINFHSNTFIDVGANGWGEWCQEQVLCDGITTGKNPSDTRFLTRFLDWDTSSRQTYLAEYLQAVHYWRTILSR